MVRGVEASMHQDGVRGRTRFAQAGLFWLLLSFVFAPFAAAQTAQDLFVAGRYQAAADVAAASETSANLSFAARSLLAGVMVERGAARSGPTIDRAIGLAERALRLDRTSVDARLQLALGLGLKGRTASNMEALRAGYATRGKALLDEARRLSPREPWAWAMTGGWHLEVLRRGGPAGATMFGASQRAGFAAFDEAVSLSPNDPAILLYYAVSMLENDAVRHRGAIALTLTRAKDAPTPDAFSRGMAANAAALLRVLTSQGNEAAIIAADRLFLYGGMS
jgi:hypothetical protein